MVRRAGLLAMALLLAAACGGGGSDGGSDESPLLQLLGAIPDTEEAGSNIGYADLDTFYDALRIEPPPQHASTEEFQRWVDAVLEPTLEHGAFPITLTTELAWRAFTDASAFQDEFGIDPAEISQMLQAGRPPRTYQVLRGSFDIGGIDDAVRNDPNFSDLLTEASYSGVDYYTWGEDFAQDYTRITPIRSLGRGGRLALDDALMLWSYWTDGLRGMIDAHHGDNSLADRDDLRAMANAADGLGVYALGVYGPASGEGQDLILAPHSAFAHGAGVDGEGPLLFLIIANNDERSAEDNTERIQARIEERKDESGETWSRIESEVSTEGILTIATFRGSDLHWSAPLAIFAPSEP